MQFWSAIDIINQVSGELGLSKVPTLFDPNAVDATQNNQLLAAINSAGNELVMYYPWEQFQKEWAFTLVPGQGSYDLPPDWDYFIDQTQWDRTNGWPLLGPRSPAEWSWLKGGLLASFPRMRYRVMGNKFQVYPTPEANSQYNFAMEYVSCNWLHNADIPAADNNAAMVTKDADIVMYHPWLMIKFTKLKWTELKGFDATSPAADFKRVWDSIRGKDVGAPVLSLNHQSSEVFIGAHSIPDGNWNV